MRDFEAGSLKLPKVFLGTSPFMGAGQFGEKAFEYYGRFYEHPENMLPLMERAVSLGWGIQPFVLPSIMRVLLQLRDRVGEYATIFSAGVEDLGREIEEASRFSETLVCVHASIADRTDLATLEGHFQNILSRGCLPGVVTHMPGATIERMQGTTCKVIMAPLNRLGWAMEPDRELSLKAILDSGIPILAKKVLAAGRIPPREALPYAVEQGVSGICVGAVSESEIEEDNALLEELGFI